MTNPVNVVPTEIAAKEKKAEGRKAAGRTLQEDKRNLRARFIRFSALLFLVILAGGSLAFFFSMRNIISSAKGNELSRMLELECIKVDAEIKKEIAIVKKLADSPLIRRHFADPERERTRVAALDEIQSYREATSANSIFWIKDADKVYFSDDDLRYRVDVDDPINSWYNMTLNETPKGEYNFNIYFNPDINQIRLWVNAPVHNDNHEPIGMVGTGIDLYEFFKKIYEDFPRDTKLYFFNDAGEITGINIDDSDDDIEELLKHKINIEQYLGHIAHGIIEKGKILRDDEIQSFDYYSGIDRYKIALGTIPELKWHIMSFTQVKITEFDANMTLLFFSMILLLFLILVTINWIIKYFLDSLYETMETVEVVSNAKSDFLAKMSHEIRTPMNAITGMAELALREDISPTAREHISTIRRSGANLLTIINDLLDFSKIESGKLEIVPSDYLFSSLVNDTISIIRMRVFETQLGFAANIDCGIPNALHGDELRIRQVLLNILSNAVKYTDRGHVSLSVTGKKLGEDTIDLTMEVVDTGKGIRPEDIDKIFDSFVQVDSARNKGVEGTGLGLPIAYSLVKAMGGDISVRSEYGVGTTFVITLQQKVCSPEPLAAIENPGEKRVLIFENRDIYANSIISTLENLRVAHKRVNKATEFDAEMDSGLYSFAFVELGLFEGTRETCARHGATIKTVLLSGIGETIADRNISILSMPVHSIAIANILNGLAGSFSYDLASEFIATFVAPDAAVLVVDDVKTNLNVAKGLLSIYDIDATLCTSGANAIEALTSERYDLVFMDHMMPEMDGVEATSRIRAMGARDPHYTNLPIVALTANAVVGMKELFLENGFSDFLSKPIDMPHLNTILEKWLPKEKLRKPKHKRASVAMTPQEKSSATTVEIADVDVRRGISISGGSTDNYMKTLDVFLNDCSTKRDEIRKSLEEGNLQLYTTFVHALKSAAANIGALKLSEAARTLEAAATEKNLEFIQMHNDGLLSALDSLMGQIDAALRSQRAASGGDVQKSRPPDVAMIRAELSKLKAAIDEVDPSAIKVAIDNLQPIADARESPIVEKILRLVLSGEDDEAASMIDSYLLDGK
ncbi:MAG: ATP-binding protein [Holophagaceae bacterium]|nr:ATP-binding protein [Holophagaceae bacterium]